MAAGLALLRALPPAAASNFAAALARRVGPFMGASKVAERNLAASLPELGSAARAAIIADVWENLARTVAEMPHLGRLPENSPAGPGYNVTGWEHIAPVVARGERLLILTGHLGNWELIPVATMRRGLNFGAFYRAADNAVVDAQIQAMRERNAPGARMFAKGAAGARGAYAHLSRGGALTLLNDQKLDNGIAAPFFGRDAMTAPALATFALKFRCPIFPVRVIRHGPARLELRVEPALALPESGDKEADVHSLTTAANAVLERWIRENPGAWLWLHRRWPKPAA